MMATKPKEPERASSSDPPASSSTTTSKSSKGADAVADLERRLRLLKEFDPSATTTSTTATSTASSSDAPSSQVVPDAPASAATKAPTTGKNALLARIMAAQEKAKQAQSHTVSTPTSADVAQDPPPAFDLLDETFNSTTNTSTLDPPPSFDVSLLSQQAPPPPAFDESLIPPPSRNTLQFDPLAAPSVSTGESMSFNTFAPSAPAFEDVYAMPPPLINESNSWDIMQAPALEYTQQQETVTNDGGIDPAILQAIMSLDGLSDAEKQALVDEAMQALQQMNSNNTNTRSNNSSAPQSAAASAADAFEQRSLAMSLRQQQHQHSRPKPAAAQVKKESGTHAGIPADASLASQVQQAQALQTASSQMVSIGSGQQVPLHGPERTQQAIASGTALIVQCLGCEHAMQVTPSATLMFCPVCETISAVNDNNTMTGKDEASAQMEADQRLAEQLQKEEYKRAETATAGSGSRPSSGSTRSSPSRSNAQRPTDASSASSGGWLEWLGVASPTTPPAAAAASQSSATRSSPSSRSGGGGLVAANTESIRFSTSDPMQAQPRVAESKPLFSCVADSIMTTANQYMAATLMDAPDDDGNVHGVDSSSLLAMPMSGVGRNPGQQQDEPSGNYQAYGN